MSGLDQRPDKQARKPVHAQEQARESQAASPRMPQRPQPGKSQEPATESQTPQDKLGAVLMALAGKTPNAMPGALTWSQAGAVSMAPPSVRGQARTDALRAHLAVHGHSRAGEVLQALTGQAPTIVATRDLALTWTTLVAAMAAGHTVIAGGGDDTPTERHGRPRAAVVCAVAMVGGERCATLLTADGSEEVVALSVLCGEFAEIAIAAAD